MSLKGYLVHDVYIMPLPPIASIQPVSDQLVSEYNESFIDRLYQMDLDWKDLLSTDPKDYEVTDDQINQLF